MNTQDLDPDMLRHKYIDEGQSDRAIGEALHVPEHRIRLARKSFGIPSRPRGSNLIGQRPAWKNGHPWQGRQHTAETRVKISRAVSGPCLNRRGERNGMYGRTGEANPNWQGGISPERQRIYGLAEWRALVEQVYVRDSGCCRNCGRPVDRSGKQSHTHHVYEWDLYPAQRFELDNLVLMCRQCHEWIHSRHNIKRLWLSQLMLD